MKSFKNHLTIRKNLYADNFLAAIETFQRRSYEILHGKLGRLRLEPIELTVSGR